MNTVQISIKELNLNPGNYVVGWWLSSSMGEPYDYVESGFTLQVIERQPDQQFGIRPASDGIVPCDFQVSRVG